MQSRRYVEYRFQCHTGYLYLPNHPRKPATGLVGETLSLAELIPDYEGIPVYLDFDRNNELIGMEISG